MQIRVMTLQDYDRVYALWRGTPGMGLNTADDSREGIARYLARNPTTCFVAEEGAELVGAILAGHDGRRGYLQHTAVALEHRRQGIARALVSHALEALEREGIHKVALVVFQRNQLGNDFWQGLGFTTREDLVYRNKQLREFQRIDT